MEFKLPEDATKACETLKDTTLGEHKLVMAFARGKQQEVNPPIKENNKAGTCFNCGKEGHWSRFVLFCFLFSFVRRVR